MMQTSTSKDEQESKGEIAQAGKNNACAYHSVFMTQHAISALLHTNCERRTYRHHLNARQVNHVQRPQQVIGVLVNLQMREQTLQWEQH